MPRLRGLQRGLRRLGVAELADQDRVGILPKHAAERLAEALGVEPDLALVDDAAAVGMEDLDRILDRDDVLVACPVDVVEHRREGRRLARAGRARDEHEAAVLVREPLHARGHAELVEAGHFARNDAEGERGGAALPEHVDPEPGQPFGGVGDVEVARLVERAQALGREARDRLERGEQVGLAQRGRAVDRADAAVAPEHGRLLQLQVDVARAELDGVPKEGVQVHGASRRESAGGVPGFRRGSVRTRR